MQDERRAAWMGEVLESAGFEVVALGEADRAGAHILITEAHDEFLEPARAFLESGDARHAIVLGPPGQGWAGLNVVVIEDIDDLGSVRSALHAQPAGESA
jgi:hypothetical protein